MFGNKIDIKKPSKTTFSAEDVRNLELTYASEFTSERDKNIQTPLRKVLEPALRTRIREYAFEKILEKGLYSFKHLLVIPNPYDASVQTALLLFVTKEECALRYQIFDEDGEIAYEAVTDRTKKHKVPVMMLYAGKTNKMNLELLDEGGEVIKRRPLTIYAREVSYRLINLFEEKINEQDSRFPYLLINGLDFNPVAIDSKLNIRYSMQLKSGKAGMIPLSNNHFLLPDKNSCTLDENKEKYSCRFLELDYMGRVYKSYIFKHQFGKVFYSDGEKFYYITSMDKGYENDWIVCFDLTKGEVLREYSIAKLIGDKYKTSSDWIKISRIEIKDDKMLIVLKNLHTVIETDVENFNINWVIGPTEIWEGTPLEKYLLSDGGFLNNNPDFTEYNVYPAAPSVLEENSAELIRPVYASYIYEDKEKAFIAVYSSQLVLPKENYTDIGQSLISIIYCDKERKKYHITNAYRTKQFYRNASLLFDDEYKNVLALAGLSDKSGQKYRANIAEFDIATAERIRRVAVRKVYNNAWKFESDILDYLKPVPSDDDYIIGDIKIPIETNENVMETTEKKLKKRLFGNLYISGGMLNFALRSGHVEAVYLKGEKSKKTYKEVYKDIPTRDKKDIFVLNIHSLPKDCYYIYVKADGDVYKLKDEIRVK